MPRPPSLPKPKALTISWKEPSQMRSRQRFKKILDAAGALLDEGGMDLFTMDNIANKASASMGSLYHFFPDRESLLMALTTKINQDLLSRLEQLVKPQSLKVEPETVVKIIFPALMDVIKQNPGTRSIFTLSHSVPAILRAREPFVEAFGKMTEIYLMFAFPHLAMERRKAAVKLFNHLSEFLMVMVTNCSDDQRELLSRESETAMTAYLKTLDEAT